MKKCILLSASLLLFSTLHLSAQIKKTPKKQVANQAAVSSPTSARMEYPFIIDENKGQFNGGCDLKSGELKVGQVLAVTDDKGKTVQMKIASIEDYRKKDDMGRTQKVSVANGPTNELFIEIQTVNGAKFDGAGGFNLGVIPKVTTLTQKSSDAICIVDGKEWKGSAFTNSCLFYENGNAFFKEKKPLLILAFMSNQDPDARQMNITIKNFQGKTGTLEKEKFEMVISGSIDGNKDNAQFLSNWTDGLANSSKTKFQLEITKWEIQGDYIIISGNFLGLLYYTNLLKGLTKEKSKSVEVMNGRFENVKVNYYKESYESQEKILKGK
jgi:hypothetical protein